MQTEELNSTKNHYQKEPWWKTALQKVGQFFTNIFGSVVSFFQNLFYREPTVSHINGDVNILQPEPQKQEEQTPSTPAQSQEQSQDKSKSAKTEVEKPNEQEEITETDTEKTEIETEQVVENIVIEASDNTTQINEPFAITEDEPEVPQFDNVLNINETEAEILFEPIECENWQDVKESIQKITPDVSLVEAADDKLILKHKDVTTGKMHEVLFSMDELNAEGLSECINVSMEIATNIVAQLESNENVINNMIKEKRVNMSVAEMEKVSIKTEYDLLLFAQKCIGKDNISNVSLDNAAGELVFKFKNQDCFDKTIRLNLATMKAEQDITEMDWNTMRETSTTTEIGKTELPVAIATLCEVLQQPENRAYIDSEFKAPAKKNETAFHEADEILETEEDYGHHKQHKKKGIDRHEMQKAAKFEQDIQSGKLPKSKAERAEERRVANSRQRKIEMAARENGDDTNDRGYRNNGGWDR